MKFVTLGTERTHSRGDYISYEKRRKRHDKINPNPYAKRTAGRAPATPALQSNSVGPAPRTRQARACRFLEYLHSVTARAHVANAGRSPAPHLNFLPIAMSHQIHTYSELRQQIHDDLRIQHPEWVEPNGDCPTCDSYESRLIELLDTFTRTGSDESGADIHRVLEQGLN
jgi:hypothetical protein